MNYEEKYKEALETVQEILDSGSETIKLSRLKLRLQSVFPELEENEDEKMLRNFKSYLQEEIEAYTYDCRDEEDRQKLKMFKYVQALLEKQGKKEQLYVRFGEIPANEKSKIYNGEIEAGTENGVSVYQAFMTDEGNIALGLTLPITKTTLHTQQHLIEYDDRPCYLVKGDYVGKDADGQPLINNVIIIKKIDSYRAKEEKQCETDGSIEWHSMLGKQDEQELADKAKPKFKVGDWIVGDEGIFKIILYDAEYGYELMCTTGYVAHFISPDYVESNFTLWTIQDARDGDVLVVKKDKRPFIFMRVDKFHPECPIAYGGIDAMETFRVSGLGRWTDEEVEPATKKQRDLFFTKMKQERYCNPNPDLIRIYEAFVKRHHYLG